MASEESKEKSQTRYKQVTKICETGETSAAKIARLTSIPPRTVSRLIHSWKAHTPVEEIRKRGRPSKITPQNKSFLGSEIAKNPFISSKNLQMRLFEKKGVQVYCFINIR
jgi:hypothetical protein